MTEENLQNLNESVSDDMLNIQIEPSLASETLMSVDSANFKEDLLTMVTFCFVLVFVFLTGVFGPPESIHHFDNINIPKDISLFEKKLTYFDISTLHSHIALSIQFNSHKEFASKEIPLRMRYNIVCYNGKSVVKKINSKATVYSIKTDDNCKGTQKLHLFNDTVISFDSIELEIILEKASSSFKSFSVEFTTGSIDHALFQTYFRIAFACVNTVLLACLIFSLRKTNVCYWHLEQKMTVPLLICAILYNNPLYSLHFYHPSVAIIILDRIVYALFHAFLSFFILVLFDSLRYKNRKTGMCFFIPKAILFVIMASIYAAHGIYDELHMYDTETGRDPIESALSYTELAVYILFIVYVLVSVVLSSIKVDVTERYKFYVYLTSGIIAVAMMAIAQVLFSFKFFYGSSLAFVMKFATENVFSMLMAYFHWPYEVLQDQQVETIEESKEAPEDFFVNDA